jgi:hypothetical protein
MVAVAQNIFSNKLIQGVLTNLPGVDPQMVIAAGATDLRNALTPEQLAKVIVIFMNSLKDSFILPIAFTGVALFLALMLSKNMRTKGGIKIEGMA